MEQRLLDEVMGIENELAVLELLKDKHNGEVYKTPECHCMDFVSDNTFYELKSRRCNKNTYKTTMVGLNKFEFAGACDRDCIFLFKFDDGLYYYKYNRTDRFDIKIGGRKDRGKEEYKKYVYIPVEKLILFE